MPVPTPENLVEELEELVCERYQNRIALLGYYIEELRAILDKDDAQEEAKLFVQVIKSRLEEWRTSEVRE